MLANIIKYGLLLTGVALLVGSICLLTNLEEPKNAIAGASDSVILDANSGGDYNLVFGTGTTWAADGSGSVMINYTVENAHTALDGGTADLTIADLESDAASTVYAISTVGMTTTSLGTVTLDVDGTQTVNLATSNASADCKPKINGAFASKAAAKAELDAWTTAADAVCGVDEQTGGNGEWDGEYMFAIKTGLKGPSVDPTFKGTAAAQ